MQALALRLEGPLQAWGGPVAGDDRPTLDLPTKSGVIGLLAGALGVERHEVSRLVALHEAFSLVVRVDRSGQRGVDFHTAEGVPTAEGKVRSHPVVSRRGYLYDASFLALLVAREPMELEPMITALRHPRFLPFLGRRACVPSAPLLASPAVLEGESVDELLSMVPFHLREGEEAPSRHEVFVEGNLVEGEGSHRVQRLRDVIVGPLPRLFGERVVHGLRTASASVVETNDVSERESIDPWF